ncbi:MAG: ribonuclease activity regulator RraA [Pseudolabrys sp.]|nr:ribonuclease activity regulator RraA [Pseudolabrys sp.]
MTSPAPLSSATRDKLARSGAANISNSLLKRGLRNSFLLGLQPLEPSQPVLVGHAFTLRFIPAREDIDSIALYQRDDSLHRRAIEECPKNAVLVMSTGNDTRVSCMGDMMALRLKMRGVAGVVTDGGFRDSPGIRSTGLPCFQRQSSGPATPITLHPVEFNAPIGCAGVAIYPGDILVGDGEGVVAIPRHLADEVADEAFAAVEYEEFVSAHLRRGRSIFGLFPATPESKAEYDRWVAAGRPSLD